MDLTRRKEAELKEKMKQQTGAKKKFQTPSKLNSALKKQESEQSQIELDFADTDFVAPIDNHSDRLFTSYANDYTVVLHFPSGLRDRINRGTRPGVLTEPKVTDSFLEFKHKLNVEKRFSKRLDFIKDLEGLKPGMTLVVK